MTLDKVDQEMIDAERDAREESIAHNVDLEKGELDPEKPTRPSRPRLMTEQRREQLSRIATASTTSSGSSSSTVPQVDMERAPTQYEAVADIERHPTALSRIQTQRSQHMGTVGSSSKTMSRRSTKKPLPAFGGGKPYPPPLPEREEYVVEFDGPEDPLHAQNWTMKKKLVTGAVLGYLTFVAAFGSSIFSTATTPVAMQFGVSTEVGILGTSLYVLGFATGPILWAPFSELYGRRLPLVLAAFGMGVFNIAVAVGKDLQTVLICRFWAGFFGASPLTIVAAVFSDMFDNRTRGMAIAVFSITVFSGPMLSPFIGGFIIMNQDLGWRWTEYITSILAWVGFGLVLLFLNETYPPAILVGKASELRRRTKNWGIHAKQEEIEVDIRELVEKNFTRPLRMLVKEPIVLLLSLYMAFIYGLLYLFLTVSSLLSFETCTFRIADSITRPIPSSSSRFTVSTRVWVASPSSASSLVKSARVA
jgi:MFS transporter, DHA1 family, multidrug resistance protein